MQCSNNFEWKLNLQMKGVITLGTQFQNLEVFRTGVGSFREFWGLSRTTFMPLEPTVSCKQFHIKNECMSSPYYFFY